MGGLLELMTVRLMAEDCMDKQLTLGFATTDTDERCGLEIRRGVCQFHPALPVACNATLTFPRQFLSDWAGGGTNFEDGIDSGDVGLKGDRSAIGEFFSKFEPFGGTGYFGLSVR